MPLLPKNLPSFTIPLFVKRIKVLHLIKSLGRGGAETLLPQTMLLHNKAAFEFHVIYFLPWKNQMVQELENAGAIVTCMAATNNLQLVGKWKQVMQYIHQHQITLVHAHLPWAGFLARWVHRQTKVPVVYTEHNKQERYHFVTRWLNKYSFQAQSMAVAVSRDVASSIATNIAPQIPVQTVMNGVNQHRFIRNEAAGLQIRNTWGLAPTDVVVGSIAVFRFQKRLDLWLEVIAAVKKQLPGIKALLVGDGPLRPMLQDKVAQLGLQDTVIMPGLHTNAAEWLSAMDIFMMSSSFEGLPLALLEAMSCECAIATTNAGGVGEVVEHEKSGWLCSVDEWPQLCDAVVALASNAELRREYASNARQRVTQHFSMASMVQQLEDIYSNLLAADAT